MGNRPSSNETNNHNEDITEFLKPEHSTHVKKYYEDLNKEITKLQQLYEELITIPKDMIVSHKEYYHHPKAIGESIHFTTLGNRPFMSQSCTDESVFDAWDKALNVIQTGITKLHFQKYIIIRKIPTVKSVLSSDNNHCFSEIYKFAGDHPCAILLKNNGDKYICNCYMICKSRIDGKYSLLYDYDENIPLYQGHENIFNKINNHPNRNLLVENYMIEFEDR
jgi:hypothetical protein